MHQYLQRILIAYTLSLFTIPVLSVTGVRSALADPQRNKELQELRDHYQKKLDQIRIPQTGEDLNRIEQKGYSESEKNAIRGLQDEINYIDSQLGDTGQSDSEIVIDIDPALIGPDGEIPDDVKDLLEREAERLRKEEEALEKADPNSGKNPDSTNPGGNNGDNSGDDNKGNDKADNGEKPGPQIIVTPIEDPEEPDPGENDSGNPNPEDNGGSEAPPCIGCLLHAGAKIHYSGSSNPSSKQNHSSGGDPENNENKPSYGIHSGGHLEASTRLEGYNGANGKNGSAGKTGQADSEGGTCIFCGSGIIPDPDSTDPGGPRGLPQLLTAKRFLILPQRMTRQGEKILIASIQKARRSLAAIRNDKALSGKVQGEQGKVVMETLRSDIVTMMVRNK